jgi:4-amino-4-deoxy-L-arabinose transferase-like glycosyltransferase
VWPEKIRVLWMNHFSKKERFLVLLIILLGFALRFYTFDQKSLWVDEIYTLNDSKDNLKEQLKFYKENPTFLHPPLFFILTHLFYPFEKPERDLRTIPMIFGTLSILMIYLLSKQFSSAIALPCTISFSLMTYHISLSQDGRSYSLLLFWGMTGLYFFLKHLQTSKKIYLPVVALIFSVLFHTSYSSIPFIVFSQLFWYYRFDDKLRRPALSSFLILNILTLLLCLPWILFIMTNYQSQPLMEPQHTEGTGSLYHILYGILHDWAPNAPLTIFAIFLLTLFPIFSKLRRNAFILLAVFFFPVLGIYLFCKLLNITHFITSRYFITFFPPFIITLFLSLEALEIRFQKLKQFLRLKFLFLILFITSNLVILPFYYHSEKQDFRGLVTYLKANIREGDKIFDGEMGYMPGILYYFQVYPEGRHYTIPFRKLPGKEMELRKSFTHQNRLITILSSNTCCDRYIAEKNRLWIVGSKMTFKNLKEIYPVVLKGYFDGSFLNFNKFPTDASMYLFLLDPSSPNEKGIDIPIE